MLFMSHAPDFPQAIRYGGGKYYMRRRILPLLPPHRYYIEPFGGGASILLAKARSEIDIYNDIDVGCFTFFKILSDPKLFEQFYERIAFLPYSRQLWHHCRRTWAEQDDIIERGWRWFVVARQSFSGFFARSWGSCVITNSKGRVETCSTWASGIHRLPRIHEKLKGITVQNQDFRKALTEHNAPEFLAYCDPPYVLDMRSEEIYEHEMSIEDHAELVQILLAYEGSVVLSGYDHDVYRPLEEAGWERFTFPTVCYSIAHTRLTGVLGNGALIKAAPRTEVVWRKLSDWARQQLELIRAPLFARANILLE